MIKFFRVTCPGQPPGTVVIVAEDTDAEFLLRWVPNTGLWHRADELSNDYLFGDESGTYASINADEAAGLIADVTPFDERRARWREWLSRHANVVPLLSAPEDDYPWEDFEGQRPHRARSVHRRTPSSPAR